MDGQFPGSGNLGKKPEESRSQTLQGLSLLGWTFLVMSEGSWH